MAKAHKIHDKALRKLVERSKASKRPKKKATRKSKIGKRGKTARKVSSAKGVMHELAVIKGLIMKVGRYKAPARHHTIGAALDSMASKLNRPRRKVAKKRLGRLIQHKTAQRRRQYLPASKSKRKSKR